MPDVFETFYREFGYTSSDYLNLVRLDPSYQVFFDNQVIKIHADLGKNLKIFSALEKDGDKKFQQYLKLSQINYQIAMKSFIYHRYDSISSLFKLDFFKSWCQYCIIPKFRQIDKIIL